MLEEMPRISMKDSYRLIDDFYSQSSSWIQSSFNNPFLFHFHYPHYHHSRPSGAIRSGPWKLLEFFEDGRLELFNLADDRSETTDLAGRYPEKAKALQAQLAAWRDRVGARMPTPNPEYDPQKAAMWWNRRTLQPLDVEAMRRRYETKQDRKVR